MRPRTSFQRDLACATPSPLGRVTLAGLHRHSRGLSFDSLRVLGSFALVYLISGSGRFRAAGEAVQRVRPGHIILVYPDLPHAYGPGGREDWNEYFIVFDGPVFDLWRSSGALGRGRWLTDLPDIRRWVALMRAAVRMGDDSPAGVLQRVCAVQRLLAFIFGGGPASVPAPPWLEEAARRLVEEPRLPPAALARALGLSHETFRRAFTRAKGIPPGAYRDRRLIELASELLHDRSLTHKEIADRLGFYDEFHFSKRFRKIMGLSPRAYRQRFPQA